MPHPTESRTSPRRIAATEKQRQALELRKGGATFAQIATTLHFRGPQGAQAAVEAGLKKVVTPGADDLRKLDSERLDVLLLAVWNQAAKGDYKAIETVLSILTRRARLLGLDAPVKLAGSEDDPLYIKVQAVRDYDYSKLTPAELEEIRAHATAIHARLALPPGSRSGTGGD